MHVKGDAYWTAKNASTDALKDQGPGEIMPDVARAVSQEMTALEYRWDPDLLA